MFKSEKSERAVQRNRRISTWQLWVGGIFGFLSGVVISYDAIVEPSFYIMFAISLYMVIAGIRRRRWNGLFHTYIEVLNERPTHSIEQLALMLNKPASAVHDNLELLIKKKFISYALIDKQTNTISRITSEPQQTLQNNNRTVQNSSRTIQTTRTVQTSNIDAKDFQEEWNKMVKTIFSTVDQEIKQEKEKEKEQKVIICSSCGAKSTVGAGMVSKCQYCGNGLVG